VTQEPETKEPTALEKFKQHWLFQVSDKELDKVFGVLEKFFSMIRGKVDIKSRLMLLADPDNILTSTILTASQVEFVSVSFFVGDKFSVLEPLKDYARTFAQANISKQGIGREQSIALVSAMQESKLLQRMGLIAEKSKGVD